MQEWLTMQNVTFGISIASFCMSIISLMSNFIVQRKRMGFRILEIKSYKTVTYFDLLVENRSHLPIAITQITLNMNRKEYGCSPVPKLVLEHRRSYKGEVYDRTMKYSTQLPITVAALGATNVAVLFEGMQQLPPDDAKYLILSIGTNRGKIARTKLELPAGWAHHRDLQ